ncbi:hypothetical protein C8R43DRAFT_956750 [Mycena crocata]|nr:hypothetical protein C8R43DRAFT_956750 [Mycena crocata]
MKLGGHIPCHGPTDSADEQLSGLLSVGGFTLRTNSGISTVVCAHLVEFGFKQAFFEPHVPAGPLAEGLYFTAHRCVSSAMGAITASFLANLEAQTYSGHSPLLAAAVLASFDPNTRRRKWEMVTHEEVPLDGCLLWTGKAQWRSALYSFPLGSTAVRVAWPVRVKDSDWRGQIGRETQEQPEPREGDISLPVHEAFTVKVEDWADRFTRSGRVGGTEVAMVLLTVIAAENR